MANNPFDCAQQPVVKDYYYVWKQGSIPSFEVVEVKKVENGVYSLQESPFEPGFHYCIQHSHEEQHPFKLSNLNLLKAKELVHKLEWDIQFYDAIITAMKPTLLALQLLSCHKALEISCRDELKVAIREFENKNRN